MKSSVISIPELQPEEHIILGCLRSEFSGGSHAGGSSAGPPHIRWDMVFDMALNWNIAPMVYPLFSRHRDLLSGLAVPEPVLKSTKAAYVKTYMVNHANLLELTKLIRALTAADIPALLLKGAHLAPFVYRDLGMRWMADIDILIRREDFQRADRVLLEAGYAYPDMGTTVWEDFGEERKLSDSGAVIEWYKTHHMHLAYSNPKAIQHLEVHWGIARNASPFAIDTEGLWERARQENLNGQRVWVLSPEDLILHISLHDAYYHHLKLFGLRPLCDIAAVIRRYPKEIDWGRLQARARKWGVGKHLSLMLQLSKELLGADIPLKMLEVRGPRGCSDPIFQQAATRILGKEANKPPYRGIKYPPRIHAENSVRGLLRQVSFFLKRIPISREELASRYSLPPSSRQVHFLRILRIASLVVSYGKVYGSYLWHRVRYGMDRQEQYNLDLWLISAKSRRKQSQAIQRPKAQS